MIRYFYWYTGAPANRPGGPWWYEDFESQENYQRFKNSMICSICKDVTIFNCSSNPPTLDQIDPNTERLKSLLKGEEYNVQAYDYEKGCPII